VKRLAPDYNPRRRKCPGCGTKDRPVPSCISARELRRQKLQPLMCPRCVRHVWAPPPPTPIQRGSK